MSVTTTRIAAAAAVAVCVIAGTSWAVHRWVVSTAVEQGAAKRDSLAALEKQSSTEAALRERKIGLLAEIQDSLRTRPNDSMLIISAANIAYDVEQFDVAERYYRLFLEKIDPANKNVRIDHAYSVFRTGRQDEAFALLRKVIDNDPKDQVALFNLGIMYAQAGQLDKAVTWLRTCVDANPDSPIGRQAADAVKTIQQST